ncbi:alpha/beta hydrolase [Methylomonas sp. MO1]|uniref:alpha/beta fold hydrolase n=1 Tax=Methylomonas sp. MO1 TaxID=3073619 RepID=UPI0028A2F6A2|nr:alpha/beta hydrolase [Methylomonas sp. MO1]MDT4288481.1 alpha/beta hydrolase [Methylomonas sp. MO1]
MSGNFLNYLIWKATTSTQTVSGDIENQGAQIRYVAYGQGEPILLLHGGLSNKLSWFSQIPWLVESGRRVILIDTRGHGESTPGHSALTYQVFAEDTLLVLDRLGIQRTNIVGWSDGGIIALILGLESPQRVGKIIAISANFHPSGVIQAADNSQVDAISPPQHKLLDWLRGWWSGAGENHPALEAEIKALWRVAPQLKHTDLQEITAPTLVIAGENDIIDLPHSGELAQMLARAKIEIVLGAGHAAPVTHARQVNQLIASFLDLNQ